MRRTLPNRALLSSTLLLAGSLWGCGGGHAGHVVVTAPSGPVVLPEVEPNDSPFDATFADELDLTSHLLIEGYVQRAPGVDVQDHHPFLALEPMLIDFCLAGDGQFADLDLSVWDDDLGAYVLSYTAGGDPETGAFAVLEAGTFFQVAVTSPFVDAFYTLEILTYPLSSQPVIDSPAATLTPDATASQLDGAVDLEVGSAPLGDDPLADPEPVARGAIRALD